MEVEKKKPELAKRDNEIIYSKSIKAGKRIYYLDVKKSRNEDLYLAITESKKRVSGFEEEAVVTYEKHKIFLYKEDFDKFLEGIEDVIGFINKEQGVAVQRSEYVPNGTEKPTVDDEKESENGEEVETKKSFFDKFKF
ncbi:MAG: DUF3276 family protein [Weeksellaceae bacterium]|jgi:hypothetical protein|nr:DUF3276 family protein [Weeksellaceae bacterium]